MRLLFSCPFLVRRKESEPSKKNGTTFTVVLKASENASQGFEDLMKKVIEKEAIIQDLCGFAGS